MRDITVEEQYSISYDETTDEYTVLGHYVQNEIPIETGYTPSKYQKMIDRFLSNTEWVTYYQVGLGDGHYWIQFNDGMVIGVDFDVEPF